jgi:hypothetical protein
MAPFAVTSSALSKKTERHLGTPELRRPNLSTRLPRKPMKTAIVGGEFFIPKSQTSHDEDCLIV